MPTNAETVSRRPEIVIVWHNQWQAEPVSSPCRFPRHQSAIPETVTFFVRTDREKEMSEQFSLRLNWLFIQKD